MTVADPVAFKPGMLRARGSARYRAKRASRAAFCLESASRALAGFQPGDAVFGVTKGQFSQIDLATAVLGITGPADVTAWTWCIADYEVEAMTAFIEDGRIRRFRLVMDWAGSQRDMPLVAEMQARFGADCIRITKTHAKLVLVENAGWRVLVRGSMNLNANPRLEQFDVTEGAGPADVVAGIVDELWERAPPLPVRELAHHDAQASFDLLGDRGTGWADGLKDFALP